MPRRRFLSDYAISFLPSSSSLRLLFSLPLFFSCMPLFIIFVSLRTGDFIKISSCARFQNGPFLICPTTPFVLPQFSCYPSCFPSPCLLRKFTPTVISQLNFPSQSVAVPIFTSTSSPSPLFTSLLQITHTCSLVSLFLSVPYVSCPFPLLLSPSPFTFLSPLRSPFTLLSVCLLIFAIFSSSSLPLSVITKRPSLPFFKVHHIPRPDPILLPPSSSSSFFLFYFPNSHTHTWRILYFSPLFLPFFLVPLQPVYFPHSTVIFIYVT